MKMAKITVNDGLYMVMIASDNIISKETGQLLLTIPISGYKTLSVNYYITK